jgi:hypothetical protein
MKLNEVVDAFTRGEVGSGNNVMSTGDRVYSYQMLIAQRIGGKVHVVDPKLSPSRTTSKHINAVLQACPGARVGI